MVRIFLKFWPVLIPLLCYMVWFIWACMQAKKQGGPIPRFRDGPVWWTAVASLLIGIGLFIYLGLSQ